ncbi:MAG: hypothetical protein RBS07_13960 [Lentimicrobium sp.]|jgi:hypothetical protein|nr:hypothetical protein [Lentimicrobium sp.]
MKLNDLLTLPEVKKHFPNAEQVIPWLVDAEIIESDPIKELHFQEVAAILFFSAIAESQEHVISETSALYPEMLLNFLMKRLAYFNLDHLTIDELTLVAISKNRIEFHYDKAVNWMGTEKHNSEPVVIDGDTFRSLWASINLI